MSSNKRHRLSRRLRTLCAACPGAEKPDSSVAVKCAGASGPHAVLSAPPREIKPSRGFRRLERVSYPRRLRCRLWTSRKPVGRRMLDERQLAHRQLMFDHFCVRRGWRPDFRTRPSNT